MTHDEWLEGDLGLATIDADDLRERVDFWNGHCPDGLESHITFNRYGDFELRVMLERPTDIAGWDEVASYDDDMDGFESWMEKLDGMSADEAAAEIEVRGDGYASNVQAHRGVYVREAA